MQTRGQQTRMKKDAAWVATPGSSRTLPFRSWVFRPAGKIVAFPLHAELKYFHKRGRIAFYELWFSATIFSCARCKKGNVVYTVSVTAVFLHCHQQPSEGLMCTFPFLVAIKAVVLLLVYVCL
jgi:hypothetical protein